MNARLLVLGCAPPRRLSPIRDQSRLKAAMVECYVDVDVGTLHYAVRQLEKDRMIAAVAEERVARGGIRTIYRITDGGRTEFRKDLEKQLETEGPVSGTLYGALLFLHLADPEIVKSALARRIARLDELIAKLGPIRKQMEPVLSTGGEHLMSHLEKQRRLDREWLKSLLRDIETSRIRDVAAPAIPAPA